jgi:hypothetical protein
VHHATLHAGVPLTQALGRMKTAICWRDNARVSRLLWLSESRGGLYYGIFNSAVDVHQSYHTDGVRHTRIGKAHHQRFVDLPLANHKGTRQLTHQGLGPLSPGAASWPKHESSHAFDSVEIIDRSALIGAERLAVEIWLSDHDSLGNLDTRLDLISRTFDFSRLLFTSTLKLSHFSGLWLSAVVLAMSEPTVDQLSVVES